MEERSGQSVRRAVQRRIDLSHNRACVARCWLYHWTTHRFDHVRGRRARLSRFDSGDQIFRRTRDRGGRSRNNSDFGDEPGPSPWRLYSLHRRGRSCRRRHHQPNSFAAHDLARFKRRAGRFARRPRCELARATNGSGLIDEDCHRWRHLSPPCDDGRSAVASAMESARRTFDCRFRFSFRNRFVAPDRRNRFIFKPDFWNDGCNVVADLPGFPDRWLDRAALFCDRAFDRRNCLHRRVQWRHDVAGFENRFSGRIDTEISTNRDPLRRPCLRDCPWPDPVDAKRPQQCVCAGSAEHRVACAGRRTWPIRKTTGAARTN